MGHTLNETVQDILIRHARMSGYNACWVPGTDHASIATEAKVVQMLRERGHADDAAFKEVGERVKKEVEAGLEFAERSPLPEGPETLEGVFANDNET